MSSPLIECKDHIVTSITITPLWLPLKNPYIWSQGVEQAFIVNLIEMTTNSGISGIGETTTAPDAFAQKLVLERLGKYFIGRSVFEFEQTRAEAFRARFLAFGGNMPRYANQLFAGLEMAALDLQGKILDRPAWDLLGGAVRQDVGYFYFLQGETIAALVEDARQAVARQHPILYLKVGVDERYDLEAVEAVRAAVGNTRIRLDANEAWEPTVALRMIKALQPYNIEYIEQPTPSWSLESLKQVKQRSPIPLGADQSVFTLHEVFQACALRAADMIAVGPREIGGLRPMIKAAGIIEGAGLNLCIHSSMSTGITTCAEHHLGRAVPNLDDGNQIMWQLLERDIVKSPSLSPQKGKLSLPSNPGLGAELDQPVVEQAAENFKRFNR